MGKKLATLLRESSHTVFFGGAGVSTESGIPDFRSKAGLYAAETVYGYPPETLLSIDFFMQKPGLFFRYYRENLVVKEARPNPAHIALAGLESRSLLQSVITQNVDGLHQAAGSKTVIELHGSNWRHVCISCGQAYTLTEALAPARAREDGVPICALCPGTIRPNVVLYGEMLDESVTASAIAEISAADLLIVGGTSLAVYPAAGFLQYFRGNNLVLINKSETPYDHLAQLIIREAIGEVFQETMAHMQ